jgi:hypothetical protein
LLVLSHFILTLLVLQAIGTDNLGMKLSAWARREGIGYQTAWQMFKGGKLPLPSHQLATGTIIVEDAPVGPNGAALYAGILARPEERFGGPTWPFGGLRDESEAERGRERYLK